MKQFFTNSEHLGWCASALLVLCILSWFVAKKHHNSEYLPLSNVIIQDKICATDSKQNPQQFFIYSGDKKLAETLNKFACEDQVVNRQFGSVRSFWNINDTNTIKFVGKGLADLALVKENIMDALDAKDTHGYQKIARYPNYQAYFIARTEKPKLEKNYLLDKTIGLLDYPTSRSGHVLPKQTLSNLGLSIERMQIRYAQNHTELRQLLLNGEVDIISSYWQKEDHVNFSINYRTAISDTVSGSAWYLRLTSANSDLVCSSQQMLQSLAKQQESSYYKRMSLVPFKACETSDSIAWLKASGAQN